MTTTQSKDPNEQVAHPRHYNQHPSGIECIEIIEHLPANLSHAFKYIWRCGLKTANDPLRELRSAEWYVRREMDRRKNFAVDGYAQTDAVWRYLAEKITAEAKSREAHDLLALCLDDLLQNDLEAIAKRLEKVIMRRGWPWWAPS